MRVYPTRPTQPPTGDTKRPEYCTAAADGSARIWDASGTHHQLYDFRVTGDGAATAVTYHPVRYELVIGYESGVTRVFDVATTRLLMEGRHHEGRVTRVTFSPEGGRLFSAGEEGSVAVMDAARVSRVFRVGLGWE